MENGATEAASHPPVTLIPRAVGGWLAARGQLPLIGVAAALMVGLGTVAVAVDATPEPPAARWLGSLDDARPEGRAARLLGAAAIGLEAEVRRVEGQRDGQLRALHDQLDAVDARQALLLDRLSIGGASATGAQPSAAISTIAAIKDGAPSLYEEVRVLRLVAAGLLLREGARSGQPFEPALERFAMVAAAVRSPDFATDLVVERIAALRPYAAAGVVSTRDLRRSFGALAAMVDRADASSWWDAALVMVGMRDDPLQPLQQAEAALLVDDLEGAVAALAALQGEAALVTEGWLGLAQARLATDAAVDELYQLALAVGVEPFADAPLASSGKIAPAPKVAPTPGPWQAAQTTPATGAWPR
jgi:hypothetical protein